jgi:hypothetical protein
LKATARFELLPCSRHHLLQVGNRFVVHLHGSYSGKHSLTDFAAAR